VDGIIYVIAGNDGVSRTGLVEAYDPTTDIWMQKTSMRGSKTFTSSCVVDGKIYVIGGAWTREDVEAYDPATDTWTWKADMPTPRYGLDTVVVDSKIYAIGGWYHSEDGPIYSTVEVFDPVTDTWTKGVDIPVTTAGLSASVVDGKIYVMGGVTATHENDNWIFTSAVYASEPIVDLNGDGIVDAADMCIIVDNWGTDNSLCDIGPTPFGDGIVDVQDLIVLAKHLCEESGLIAYWMLDETEGDIAYDSVGGYNGTLVGDPTWQTDVGMIAGALEFDGIDDYVITDFVLNPADGPFSVFAWVQGGAQGEVILSQVCPMNWDVEWLLADPVTGALATDQKLTLLHKTLTTNVVITDGEWHRVGLSWNGSERKLYVDNIEVARDSQTTLAPGGDGLQIGTGSKRTRNSYWSGLIDDVRIYDRALTAEEIAVMAQ
jgi:N-acetylneuraminic acid mutarotase